MHYQSFADSQPKDFFYFLSVSVKIERKTKFGVLAH